MDNVIFNWLKAEVIFSEAKNMLLETSNNKEIVKITENYGIYKHNGKEFKDYEIIDNPIDYNVKAYNIEDKLEMIEILSEYADNDSFFGSIVLAEPNKENEKLIPYNPLSITFLNKINSLKVKKIFIYEVTEPTIDNNKVNEYYDLIIDAYGSIDDIVIKKDGSNQTKVNVHFRETNLELEKIGLHLSDLHKRFEITNDTKKEYFLSNVIVLSDSMFNNCEIGDKSNISADDLPSNWAIEHSLFEKGIIVPTYGLFGMTEDRLVPIAPIATDHPNISNCRTNYCTGVNSKHSIKGISELCYGNLNSPLNSQITIKDSLNVAKAYIKFFIDLLLEVELDDK